MTAMSAGRSACVRAITLILAAVLTISVTASALGPLPPAHAQLFGISEQQEIQIGRQVQAELARKPGFLDNAGQLDEVRSIGLRLARVSERPGLPWTYHILNDTSVNAMAAPGGFIFVTRGLLDFVKRGPEPTDELAFVLGHETTHVAHRHAVQLAQRDMELQFGAVLLTQILFGGSFTAYQLSQLGRALIDAKYSRDKEFEADHYGVIYMKKAGFDPTAALVFFDRLEATEKQQPGAFQHAFEDHPDTPARIAAIRTELRQMGYHVAGPVTPAPAAPAPSSRRPVPEAPVPVASPPPAPIPWFPSLGAGNK
jgi:predicted Zn-dependent protease